MIARHLLISYEIHPDKSKILLNYAPDSSSIVISSPNSNFNLQDKLNELASKLDYVIHLLTGDGHKPVGELVNTEELVKC
jgi:hypothetical protein